MDNNSPHSSQPCRGIIVVDTSELGPLSAPILGGADSGSALASLSHPTETYLDLLVMLSQQGFRVIVPEAVLKESANRLKGGIDIDQYFPRSVTLYDGESIVKTFLSDVNQGRYDGIEIEPAAGESDYALHLASLRKAASIKTGDPVRDPFERRFAIEAANDLYPRDRRQDFGELHGMDIIENILKKQDNNVDAPPIFFLGVDREARKKLRDRVQKYGERVRVDVLSACGIFNALEKDQYDDIPAWTALGLKGEAKDHWEHIRATREGSILPEFWKTMRNEYHDSPVQAFDTGRFPFAEAVKGIAEEIIQGHDERAAQERAAPQQLTQVDKFTKKYGGNYGRRDIQTPPSHRG